jgi:tRNA1(Val) A37 N6-methylase TrmN6
MKLIPVELPFGKTIYQTEYGQSVSSDVAFFVNEILRHEENCHLKLLELGSGNGILSLMLAYYRNQFEITGIEIQPHLVELAVKNAENTGQNVHFMQADLNEYLAEEKQDIICCNPPFQRVGEGKISPYQEKVISRTESKTTMQAVFHTISRNLKTHGSAYLIYPQSRLDEVDTCLEKAGLISEQKKLMNGNKKKIVFIKVRAFLKNITQIS